MTPDHASGAVTLAADDTGAPTALHITPAQLPHDVNPNTVMGADLPELEQTTIHQLPRLRTPRSA